VEYNVEAIAYFLHKEHHLLVLLSQRIGERPRGHLFYQPCNTTFSNIISRVKRKDKVIKANTQMMFTVEYMPMYAQLS